MNTNTKEYIFAFAIGIAAVIVSALLGAAMLGFFN